MVKISVSTKKGKKTLLTFYRFATCPFCNLRIHEIINRYEELGKNFEKQFLVYTRTFI